MALAICRKVHQRTIYESFVAEEFENGNEAKDSRLSNSIRA
jgi:hypothetical protein